MNAVATSTADDNGTYGSDSDSNSDDFLENYQPISTFDNGGGSEDEDGEGDSSDLDLVRNFHHLPNGLSSLDLNNDDHEDDEDEEEEEEDAIAVTESERALELAFREDERRRDAPFTAENAARVMEVMRQVSIGGSGPDWAVQVPEDQWIDRLRRLRQPSSN
ncbi:hypothetical protein OROHE_012241 [Orobanche hederae]